MRCADSLMNLAAWCEVVGAGWELERASVCLLRGQDQEAWLGSSVGDLSF